MPAPRPFRFGLQAAAAPPGASWPELARKVEDLGYSTLTVSDHLDDQLAITPALMAAADATTTLRLGSLTYCNDYRHPVVLAKETATLDLLSGGRLEVGLGAGWMTSDYEQSGIVLDPAGARVERLAEAVEIVTRLWSDGPCRFDGRHYRVRDLDGRPKPVQRPRPPILVGGGGRRVLSLAGRVADIVGLNIALGSGRIDESAGPTATAASTEEKVGWVRAAAGERFDQIELHVRIHLAMLTDDRAGIADAVAPGFGLSPADALDSPHALVGSLNEIAEQCLERRERFGISYIGLGLEAIDAMAPVVARLAGT
ncbi:MAG TPA: LLM class F420-dependent oxidoreductase [Acidimicrobiales bacterium]|nr:LLM class F420-dependent oxidoreductase [Acidimicrobiales bacterium]